jgi:Acyl-CoA oxidase, C-alpha1 domain
MARRMSAVWQEMSALQTNEEDMKEFLAELPHLHAIAAGMKCWWGWWAAESLELCRRCMGGHGYSAYNSIADLISSFGVMTTGTVYVAEWCMCEGDLLFYVLFVVFFSFSFFTLAYLLRPAMPLAPPTGQNSFFCCSCVRSLLW